METEEKADLITQAQTTAERLEKANQEYKLLIERAEKITAMGIVSGKSIAGVAPKTQDEIYQNQADELIRRFK